MTEQAHGAVVVSLAAGRVGEPAASTWIKIAPRGRIATRDHRSYAFDPETLSARFNADDVKIPVDFNHATEILGNAGHRSDAIGWVEEMEPRPDGLYGRVEWLADGTAALTSKTYRYISPSFPHDAAGNATWIKSVALVTSPALAQMPALAQAETMVSPSSSTDLMSSLRTALSLAPDASDDDILAAIETIKASAISNLNASGNVQLLLSELAKEKGEMKAMRVAGKVETAMKRGAFPPYMRDWATALCSSDEAAFGLFVNDIGTPMAHLFTSPITPEMERRVIAERTPTGSAEDAAKLARQLGIDPSALERKP